jgi:hypothetical protein
VTADGEGLVSHVGVALLVELADRVGLTAALSGALSRMPERAGFSHIERGAATIR